MPPRGLSRAGSWTFIDKLGEGGGGSVFLGRRIGLNGEPQKAAIKVVQYNAKSANRAYQLIHEHELLTKLDSPYIAKTFDSGQEQYASKTYFWIAVEQVKGDDLRHEVESDGPLSRIEWLHLAHDLFMALKTAHDAGIIHKDIKPENIIRNSRRSILIDFGFGSYLDKRDLGDSPSISLGWTAPEQMDYKVDPEKYTPGVDLFQAAAVLVYAGTGKAPWPLPDFLLEAWRQGGRARLEACRRYAIEFLSLKKPNFHDLDDDLVEMLKPLLNPVAKRRGSVDDVLEQLDELLPKESNRKTLVPDLAEPRDSEPEEQGSDLDQAKAAIPADQEAKAKSKMSRRIFKGCLIWIFLPALFFYTVGVLFGEDDETSAKRFPSKMPNLVGVVLEDAKTTLLDLEPAVEDANGEGDPIRDDADWQVCTQNLAPGVSLTASSTVVLKVVELRDRCPNLPDKMPNIVGLKLNQAIEKIGDLVSNADWEDISGNSEGIWWEENWQVCTQTPSADALVRKTTPVQIGVVRVEDVCP